MKYGVNLRRLVGCQESDGRNFMMIHIISCSGPIFFSKQTPMSELMEERTKRWAVQRSSALVPEIR